MPSSPPTRLLSAWFEDASQATSEPLGDKCGLSGAVIWRVSIPGNDLCLRRWPQSHPSLSGLQAIHGLLEHVATAGCDIVPVPLATRSGETHFVHEDHLWELTRWMPGEASLSREHSSGKLAAAMGALARFHHSVETHNFSGDAARLAPSPGLRARLAMIEDLQQGELQLLWRASRAAEASDLRELAFELLEGIRNSLNGTKTYLQQIVDVPLPLQWCLCDVHHDHILFAGEEVSGLLDFGAVAVDSVAGDLARLLGSLVHDYPESWRAGIEAYDHHRRLSPAESRAIVGFDQGGLICSAANWVRWLFVEGRSYSQVHALRDRLRWLRDRLQTLASGSTASGTD